MEGAHIDDCRRKEDDVLRAMVALLTRLFVPGFRCTGIVSHDPSFEKVKQGKKLNQVAEY